ncbi:MAG: acetyl-CoA carboxylase biotin carboxylase subunit [Candidatus Marinimicrobia bacterium]|jgi:acetyl-CoA carboxylase biotin carboxylase subunit|nr:acetyl-CoA carboxylase biotin carboxylase subunit [Candidatus Neomarinimicrobiota bacterium]MBT4317300.1 acetyl-CoA carboxylase biotin carboxylase subunit [Candidatus Neomarinimicrobiota bacterium]MBT4706733.1 acetyl-CoA carboxylase biotin carboxylase subunit [Candidatus Neomarinimicrobiota bacterium]MBT4925906.1 acetyl-CoA carboxylase biotin carboxylase subunit [Candidatus Neomarinimicrobiota bacterium]MBT5251710.1 acetyl-CoA carboxylase biotin carboxylase subunit [Candidatus Neomarinimicro
MFKKILIANRGEIAIRVIRACKEMGIKTVAVYSKADEFSLHIKFADEAICIGAGPPLDSYLNIPRIIAAAEISNADAIHPGYGFLAENAQFSGICEENGFCFIGPDSKTIDLMGDKVNARKVAEESEVPIVPGSNVLKSVDDLLEIANNIGYPVMLKASGGGGGKGMRVLNNASESEKGFSIIQSEATKAFNNPEIYVEKFIKNGRHIEVQILGDKFGNHVHFGERECSVQRNNQKLIEECPSAFVDEDLREVLTSKALSLAKKVSYVGVGTVEFLVDEDKNFYFIEMNTRIQVEHTVTEMVYMIDLVKEQIKMHFGKEISFNQDMIKSKGHSIECRLNAEDPFNNFIPSPKKIDSLNFAGGIGVRIDSYIYAGYQIPPFYDSLLGKLIVHSNTRKKAIIKMQRALEETFIEGPNTTLPLLEMILSNNDFISGNFDINFLSNFLKKMKGEKIESSKEFDVYI